MAGSRFNAIAKAHWAWLGPAFKGLSDDLEEVESAVAAGAGSGGGVHPGTIVSAAPSSTGVWSLTKAQADALHTAGARIMWLRAKPDGTNADIPTAGVGYVAGDLVYPVLAGETLSPAPGILFSDSMQTASTVDLNGKFTDKYAGGGDYTWAADMTTHPANSRARIQPGTGLELYYNAVAYISAPALPASNYSVSFTMPRLTAGLNGGVVVRGQSWRANRLVIGFNRNAGDATKMDIRCDDSSTGATSTAQLGTVTFTADMEITVKVVGDVVNVEAAGQTFSPTLSTAAKALPQRFGLWAEMYSSLEAELVRYEVLA